MYLVVRPMENCIEEGEFTPRYAHAAENFWYNQKKNQQHNQMSGWRELCSAVAMSRLRHCVSLPLSLWSCQSQCPS